MSSKNLMRRVDREIAEKERLESTGIKPKGKGEIQSTSNNNNDDKFWQNATPEQRKQVIANQRHADELREKWEGDIKRQKTSPPSWKKIGAKKRGGPGTAAA